MVKKGRVGKEGGENGHGGNDASDHGSRQVVYRLVSTAATMKEGLLRIAGNWGTSHDRSRVNIRSSISSGRTVFRAATSLLKDLEVMV